MTMSEPAVAIEAGNHHQQRTVDGLVFAGLLAAAIVAALGAAAAILALADRPAGEAFEAMIRGSLGSTSAIVASLNHTAPILIVAVGAVIAGRAALVNVGQEGQLLVGATFGAIAGTAFTAPAPVMVPLVLVSAAIGGALWVGIATVLRYVSGVNEVVSTLLLNFLAVAVVSYLVNAPSLLQERLPEGSVRAASPQTDAIAETAHLPALLSGTGYRLHAGVLIGVVLAVVVAFLLGRTRWGFRLQMFGYNPRAARRAGVSSVAMGAGALLLSGAFAGLAGGVVLAGSALRVNPGVANNYGWEGLLVALVARYNAIAAIVAAFLFGALRAGGGALAATGVDSSIVGVIQALVVLAVMLPSLYMRRRGARRTAEVARLAAVPTSDGTLEAA